MFSGRAHAPAGPPTRAAVGAQGDRMPRFLIPASIVLLCSTVPVRAQSAAGSWQCTAVSTEVTHWTLTVREAKNNVSGSLTDGVAVFPLIGAKRDGETFTFKISIDEKLYTTELKVEPEKLEGKYTGPDAAGTLKCKRQ